MFRGKNKEDSVPISDETETEDEKRTQTMGKGEEMEKRISN